MSNVGTVALQGKSLARTVPPLLALMKEAIPTLADPAAKSRLAEGSLSPRPAPVALLTRLVSILGALRGRRGSDRSRRCCGARGRSRQPCRAQGRVVELHGRDAALPCHLEARRGGRVRDRRRGGHALGAHLQAQHARHLRAGWPGARGRQEVADALRPARGQDCRHARQARRRCADARQGMHWPVVCSCALR